MTRNNRFSRLPIGIFTLLRPLALCIVLSLVGAICAEPPGGAHKATIKYLILTEDAKDNSLRAVFSDKNEDLPNTVDKVAFCVCPKNGYAVTEQPCKNVYDDKGKFLRTDFGKLRELNEKSPEVIPIKKEFLLSEMEISQKTFFKILDAKKKEWKDWKGNFEDGVNVTYNARRIERQEYLNAMAEKTRAIDEYPMYPVSIDEAAFFCHLLKEIHNGKSDSISFFSYVFRLPTHTEWQYACRAKQELEGYRERPHFNLWPDKESFKNLITVSTPPHPLYDQTAKNKWDETLKERNESATDEDFYQHRLLEMLLDSKIKDNQNTARLFLGTVFQLEKGLGLKYEFDNANEEEPFRKPDPGRNIVASNSTKDRVPGTGYNEWGLYDMHGGVAEWVLDKQEHFNEIIGYEYKSNDPNAQPQEKTVKLAGGHFRQNSAGEGWQEFTIWKAKEVKYPSEVVTRNTIDSYYAGIRVLIEVGPKPNPHLVARRLVSDKSDVSDDTIKRLKKELVELKEHDAKSAEKATSSFNYYLGLAYNKSRDYSSSEEPLKVSKDNLARSQDVGEDKQTLVETMHYLSPRDKTANK